LVKRKFKMKTNVLFLFALFSYCQVLANIDFVFSYDKAKEIASRENKIIFVDVMADWCKPCKKMIQDINANEQVYKYFNDNYVNLQINEQFNKSFLGKFNISAFPTLLFITNNGEILESIIGYPGINSLMLTAQKHQKNASFITDKGLTYYENLEESALIKELNTTLAYLPEDLRKTRLQKYLKQSPKLGETLIHHFSSLLDYTFFYEYIDMSKIKGNSIAEKLAVSYLNKNFFNINTKDFAKESEAIAKITATTAKKILVYMLSYREIVLLKSIGKSSLQNEISYSKYLLQNYPEVSDLDLLYSAFYNIMTSVDDEALFTQLYESLNSQVESQKHYAYYDILSVISLKLGKKEEAVKYVNLAMTNYDSKTALIFNPLIVEYKKQIRNLKP
jgi:thiol-disulfide isomerase/thioredoxin